MAPTPKPFRLGLLSVFASPDYNIPFVSTTIDKVKVSDETHPLRFTSGLSFEFKPVQRISIEAGVAYSEIDQEKGETEIKFSKYITQPFPFYSSLGEMLVDPNVMREDFSPLAPIDTFHFNYKYSQQVSFLTVPVKVKLNFGQGKFSTFISAGAVYQYIVTERSTLDLIKEHFTTVLTYTDMKLNRSNIAVSLSAGLRYKFLKRLSLFLEPQLRYNLNNLNSSSALVNKQFIIGGNAGLSFHL